MGFWSRMFGRGETAPVPTVRKARRAYDAAAYNRLVSDWVASMNSADAEVRGGAKRLRDRARDLVRNQDYARNAQRAIVNNVVGQGIGLQAQVMMRRGGRLDVATNDAIESAWREWCRADNCHTAGVLSFPDIERLLVGSAAESGEVFIRLVRQRMGESRVPLALEVLEAELLDEEYNDRLPGGNEIRMGVERNQWGRPVAYHFLTKHPGDTIYTTTTIRERVRVPAKDVIHLFRVERPGQTRGVSWYASAILRAHHLKGYEEAEVIRARAEASVMGFIQSPEADALTEDTDQGQDVTSFEPGTIKRLMPGETFEDFTPARAGGAFDPFMRAMLRGMAAGLGVSYETLSKDYSQTNYSSSRLALLDDRDNWRVLQQWLIANFHERVFREWLDLAVLSGTLQLPGYETQPEAFRAVRWMPRGWSWVDPAKEVKAYKEAIAAGLTTQTDVIAQAGGDIEDVLTTRAREVAMAEELGLTFDTIVQPEPPAVEAEDEAARSVNVTVKMENQSVVTRKDVKLVRNAAGVIEGAETTIEEQQRVLRLVRDESGAVIGAQANSEG